MLRGAADMHVGMSGVYRERNELDAAKQQLLESDELGEHTGLGQNPYRRRVAMARISQVQGTWTALSTFSKRQSACTWVTSPRMCVLSWRPRYAVWLAQGRVGEALGWAREQGLSAEDDLSYLREFEYITLARVLLARYQAELADHIMDEVAQLLARLLIAAEEGERAGSVIEILIVQALTHYAQGDIPAALVPLERALKLAAPEGYVRIFVDGGPPMASLLSAAASQGISPDYTRQAAGFPC